MTFVTSLKDSADYIWSCFGKNVKYEIHRAEKEGSGVRVFTSQDLSENIELCKTFDKVYAAMYRSKGIVASPTLKSDIAIANQGNLLMTVGYLGDGGDVVYHVYVIDGKNARLLYSASDFRNSEDNQQRNKIGRLNRYLHWKDILYFKDEGYDEYDWGGYSLDADKKSITDFKAGFGGVSRKTYVYTYELTWKAKFVRVIRLLLRK